MAGIVIQMQKLEQEYQALPQDTGIRTAFKMLVQEQHKYETKTAECKEIEERWKKLSEADTGKMKKESDRNCAAVVSAMYVCHISGSKGCGSRV